MDRWCADRGVARGATVQLEQAWQLAGPWYANRLDEQWMPRGAEEIERLLSAVGLTGDFWRVR